MNKKQSKWGNDGTRKRSTISDETRRYLPAEPAGKASTAPTMERTHPTPNYVAAYGDGRRNNRNRRPGSSREKAAQALGDSINNEHHTAPNPRVARCALIVSEHKWTSTVT